MSITRRNAVLLVTSLLLSASALGSSAPDLASASFTDILTYCQQHPDTQGKDATTGDCLGEQTEQLEHLAQTRQATLLDNQCPAVKLQAMIAQQQWQSYRTNQCGLYRAMADNTTMYDNSQACRLQLTLDYRDQVSFLAEHTPQAPLPCDTSP
ncbi:lysozyme inhibitor LprI family protein [Halopseudomonas salegens]|uniref:Lysozyme inhibitor LprI N-terminal domain-containing protein n=1 Tax=Halopseudomonas salegens TaxID=1434072 RepID=A0A1H2E1E3_9GAMM|nr:lysozyme inhibitor LprI family protein [Halopseudomonas salegens]SDT88875.1 Protein of unknown function [Halopseudomonas salegens]